MYVDRSKFCHHRFQDIINKMATSLPGGSIQSLQSTEVHNLLSRKDKMLDKQATIIFNLQAENKEKDQRLSNLLGAMLAKDSPGVSPTQPSEDQNSDDQEGYSSDTSIELDENFQLLEALRKKGKRDQVVKVTENLQKLGLNETLKQSSQQATPSEEALAVPKTNLGPDVVKRLLDENIRLKGYIKDVHQKWKKVEFHLSVFQFLTY